MWYRYIKKIPEDDTGFDWSGGLKVASGELSINKNNMNTFKKVVSSRTVWTVVVMFVVSGIGAVHNFIPTSWFPLVDGVLAILAVYFRLNPRV